MVSASNSGRPEGARGRPPKERPASAFSASTPRIKKCGPQRPHKKCRGDPVRPGGPGTMLLAMGPENGNFAWDFLRKNYPVAFPAAGELRFRLGRPRTSLLGIIFKHPEDGDFACVFLAKTSPVPADATGAWRFRWGFPRQTNAGPISNLTEKNDWVRDFLTKQLRVVSPAPK